MLCSFRWRVVMLRYAYSSNQVLYEGIVRQLKERGRDVTLLRNITVSTKKMWPTDRPTDHTRVWLLLSVKRCIVCHDIMASNNNTIIRSKVADVCHHLYSISVSPVPYVPQRYGKALNLFYLYVTGPVCPSKIWQGFESFLCVHLLDETVAPLSNVYLCFYFDLCIVTITCMHTCDLAVSRLSLL